MYGMHGAMQEPVPISHTYNYDTVTSMHQVMLDLHMTVHNTAIAGEVCYCEDLEGKHSQYIHLFVNGSELSLMLLLGAVVLALLPNY